MEKVKCPYCNNEQSEELDFNQYNEDHIIETQCLNCEKIFVFTVHATYILKSKKADCLNGDYHNFTPYKIFPTKEGAELSYFIGRYTCKVCGRISRFTKSIATELGLEWTW